jgi:hypothetical protein
LGDKENFQRINRSLSGQKRTQKASIGIAAKSVADWSLNDPKKRALKKGGQPASTATVVCSD